MLLISSISQNLQNNIALDNISMTSYSRVNLTHVSIKAKPSRQYDANMCGSDKNTKTPREFIDELKTTIVECLFEISFEQVYLN